MDSNALPPEIRHARTLQLPEIGEEGLKRLQNSSVLIVGAGALGCMAAMYLAAAGVGRIAIADFDLVGLSNLQRQLAYTEEDLGKSKCEVLSQRLHLLNSDVKVEIINEIISRKNIREYVKEYDLIVEGSDNPSTKYLVSDTCHVLKKPCVIGGVREWTAQVTTQLPEGPVFRDVFPETAQSCGMTPCSAGGVMPTVPGIAASIQATEAIKIITGAGRPLCGRLFQLDTLTMTPIVVRLPEA